MAGTLKNVFIQEGRKKDRNQIPLKNMSMMHRAHITWNISKVSKRQYLIL